MKKAKLIMVVLMLFFAFIAVSFIPVSAEPQHGKDKLEYPIKLPQTGQIWSEVPGDDGDLQMGVQFPVPRFKDNNNGTVTDRLTNLVWLKNARCFEPTYWYGAIDTCNNLKSGDCGLSDNSLPGDWRLPNRNELLSLIDVEIDNSQLWDNTDLPSGHPFINVHEDKYWTSTTTNYNHPAGAWALYMYLGRMDIEGKSVSHFVWPVRSEKEVHHGHDGH